ncbi:hypothetical protein [Streptomyces sennicomposti]
MSALRESYEDPSDPTMERTGATRSGGSLQGLHGYNLNDQTRSLKINRDGCG